MTPQLLPDKPTVQTTVETIQTPQASLTRKPDADTSLVLPETTPLSDLLSALADETTKRHVRRYCRICGSSDCHSAGAEWVTEEI